MPSPARRAEGEEFARRFFDAAAGGDMDALLGMLAPDVVFRGDGGGKAQAIAEPLAGGQRVLRLLGGLFRRGKVIGAYHRLAWVNGQPGAVTYDADGRVVNVFALDIADGMVQAIRSVVNPDKLGHLGPGPTWRACRRRMVRRRPDSRHGTRSTPPVSAGSRSSSPRRSSASLAARILTVKGNRPCTSDWPPCPGGWCLPPHDADPALALASPTTTLPA